MAEKFSKGEDWDQLTIVAGATNQDIKGKAQGCRPVGIMIRPFARAYVAGWSVRAE